MRIPAAAPLIALAGLPAVACAQVQAPAPAVASTDAPAATDESDPERIGDLVVSAERVSTTLQKASLSVTAISADTLRQGNITEITGLNGLVPSLVVARTGGGEREITIRGIGSETPENPSTQPGVALHVDGVYIFNSIAWNAAFIDLAQVEVLRGPQGTVYGQGSTGGTINLVSQTPQPGKLTGSADVGYGNYNLLKADGAINVPVGETLAVRAAIQRQRHDGYAKATAVAADSDYDLDDADEWGGKLAVLWKPGNRFSVLLNTIQYQGDSNAAAQKNVLDPSPDARALTQDFPGKSNIRTQLYYGLVKYDFGGATLSSISSYQKLHSDQSWDADGLDAPLFLAVTGGAAAYDHVATWDQHTTSYTQEFDLASNGKRRLRWIVGAVYLHSRNKSYINEYRSATGSGLNPPLALATAYDDPSVATLAYAELSSITRAAYAGFFQGTYDLAGALRLTVGARYNHDKYSGTSDSLSGGALGDTPGNYLQAVAVPGLSTGRVTGKAAIEYDLRPRNMVYASYTRGFKPGGLNASAAAGNSSYTVLGFADGLKGTYRPEQVDAIEVGAKNRFAGDTVQLNASAFYYWYRNLQFLEADAILFVNGISNAPRAEIYGAEAELDWRATRHLRFEGSLSLVHGTFTADYDALDPTDATAAQNAAGYGGTGGFYGNFYLASLAREAARRNINGNDVPNLPSVQGAIAATWRGAIGPGLFTARAQVLYRGKFNAKLFDDGSQDRTPAYAQANLFGSYAFGDSGLSASVTLTNLFDKDGVNARFTDPYGSAQVSDTTIAPRQLLVSLGYTF